jgi:tetratricopeptide (TPR) repeat protein
MSGFNYDIINRYLDGEMNAEEVQAFEFQLKQDNNLQAELALLKDVNETLRMKLHPDQTEQGLAITMQDLKKEYFKSGARIIPIRKFRWIMAAAAVVISFIVLTIWQPWRQDDLYRQYASIEMPGMAERGIPVDSLLKKARDNFNHKNFVAAIPIFDEVLKTDPQNSLVQFYYAISLLEIEKIEKARSQFTQIYNGTSLFRFDAAFYLALSYIKSGDKTNAVEWLKKIPAGTGYYDKATGLLKKL